MRVKNVFLHLVVLIKIKFKQAADSVSVGFFSVADTDADI